MKFTRFGDQGAGAVDSFNGRTGAVVPAVDDYSQSQISGLKTSDSPYFTALNVGHATDSTITRVSAGLIAIEGNNLIRANDIASTTAAGITEHATAAEINTGSATNRSFSPNEFRQSDHGTAIVFVMVHDGATELAVGDDAGDAFYRIPVELNGWDLVDVEAIVDVAGTTGTTDIQVRNATQAADMLTTKITIDSTETDSSTAAVAPSIDTANDDVATGDKIVFDVDAVSTTAPFGLGVELHFRKP